MKTRTLSRGTVVEAYNEQVRIRLQFFPNRSHTLVTVFYLKPNGYYYRKIAVRVQYPIKLQEVIETYETLTQAA